jgi:hypothetical protein
MTRQEEIKDQLKDFRMSVDTCQESINRYLKEIEQLENELQELSTVKIGDVFSCTNDNLRRTVVSIDNISGWYFVIYTGSPYCPGKPVALPKGYVDWDVDYGKWIKVGNIMNL